MKWMNITWYKFFQVEDENTNSIFHQKYPGFILFQEFTLSMTLRQQWLDRRLAYDSNGRFNVSTDFPALQVDFVIFMAKKCKKLFNM